MPGWRVVGTLHTGPGMGLLGARVQLAGLEEPPGTSPSPRSRQKFNPGQESEREMPIRDDETQLVLLLLLLRFPEASPGRSEQLSK